MKRLFIFIVIMVPFSFCAAAHPKLFFTNSDVTYLQSKITQPQYAAIWASIKQTADNYCNPASSQYLDPSSSFFTDYTNAWYGRDVEGYLEILGFAYQMTGDSKYGLKGAAILDKAVDYVAPPTSITQPYNLEISRTYAVGYDWLYTAMTSQQRSRVEALAPTYINWSLQTTVPGWGRPYHNYNGVGYGAMGLFALATEDVYPSETPGWLSQIQGRLTDWFNNGFDAQGAYCEGHDYMQYGFSNGLAFADALLRNKSINLFNNANLQMVPSYLTQIRLPGESTFEARNDSHFSHYFDVSMLRLAGAVNSPLLEWMWQQGLAYCPTADDYHKGGLSPMRILWESNITLQTPMASGEPLAEYFQGIGLVTFRSGWDTQNSLFTIQARPIHAGTHDQADKGHFGFYSLGYRWAADSFYGNNRDIGGRSQTEAHSCIFIDNVGQVLTGASYQTNGKILKYENHDLYGYALADACDAYNTNDHGQTGTTVDHALRHAVYVRERDQKPPYTVIFDDIKKRDSNLHNYLWQMISWHNMDVELGGANPLVIPIEYVETPIGTTGTGTCSWTVNVTTAGTYELWARVRASGVAISSSDSFYVQVDSGSQIYWTFPQKTEGLDAAGSLGWTWGWGKVVDSGNGGASVTFTLSAGSHVIQFKTRETGAQIASAFLTNKVGQTPKYTDSTQGILLKAKTAAVTAPMVFRPRDSQMEVVMDANSALTFSYDFYEPGDGRIPASVPRFKANCTAVAPKFATVLIPHSMTAAGPAVTFQKTPNGEIVNVTWPDRADQIVLSGSEVTVNLGGCAFAIPADLNKDCVVDFADVAILAQSWSMNTYTGDLSTLALWHMDAVVGGKIIDDDAANPGRNNDLTLYNGATVTTDSGGELGEALNLNGTSQYGQADVAWASQNSVKIDMWFKAATTSGARALAAANNTWELRQSNTDMIWYTYYAGGSARSVTVPGCIPNTTNWHHVIASIDTNGLLTLTVDGTTQTVNDSAHPLLMQNAILWVGMKSTRYFQGLIDEVKITIPSIPGTVCTSGYSEVDLYPDCSIDMKDFNIIAQSWLSCSTLGDHNCAQQ